MSGAVFRPTLPSSACRGEGKGRLKSPAHFKHHTANASVIMGRKTWDSLPLRFKPLPGRTNIALAADSLDWALALCASQQPRPADVWVIGGAQLLAAAMPLAERAVVTELDRDFAGDVFAPELDAGWMERSRDEQVAPDGMRFAFVTYVREPAAQAPRVNQQVLALPVQELPGGGPAAHEPATGSAATSAQRPFACEAIQASMNAMVCAPSAIRGYGACVNGSPSASAMRSWAISL